MGRPVTRAGEVPLEKFRHLENVLDILQNYWTHFKKFEPLSGNSSPLLVSQAGYGPDYG